MDSPYKTTFTHASPTLDMDVSSQIDKYKEDEVQQKAQPIQPYTLDNSKELLSQIYERLIMLRNAVNNTKLQPKTNNNALQKISKIIENISKEVLIDIPEQIDKLNL